MIRAAAAVLIISFIIVVVDVGLTRAKENLVKNICFLNLVKTKRIKNQEFGNELVSEAVKNLNNVSTVAF